MSDRDYNAFATLGDVQKYCEDRLSEIRAINASSKTPSGFVCMAAFIGFLANLASGTAEIGNDCENYKNFAKTYMGGICPDDAKADELYKVLRCGLLHAMSFYQPFQQGKMPPTRSQPPNKSRLMITHDACAAGSNPDVIRFDDLYAEVELAIQRMFADGNAASKVMTVVYWQPPITGNPPVAEPKAGESDDSSASAGEETKSSTSTHLSS